MRWSTLRALALFAAATPAGAADWKYITTGNSGTVWFADVSNIRNGTRTHAVWVKLDHSANAKIAYRSEKQFIRLDCNLRNYRTISWVGYRADGTVYNSGSVTDHEYDFGYEQIVPDSVMEGLAEVIC